jgi:hypothetical protein
MGALLESGRVGNVNVNHLKLVREDVINRWDNLGLLEGLKGYAKENIAQLFENQASWMLNESTALGVEGSFETVVFPIVRRVFSKLLANEIVSVQALNLPIGKLFFFVPKIGASGFDYTNGGGAPGNNQLAMAAGNGFDNNVNLYDAFYGEDGMFDKSKGAANTVNAKAAGTGSTNYATVTAAASGLLFDFARTPFSSLLPNSGKDGFKPLYVGGTLAKGANAVISGNTSAIVRIAFDTAALANTKGYLNSTSGYGGGSPTTYLFENADEILSTLTITSTATKGTVTAGDALDFNFATQKYGNQIMLDDNGLPYTYVIVSNPNTTVSSATNINVSGLTISAKAYDSLENSDDMGEVSFELKSVTVSVIERKLRATWSPELAQDVSAFHNIDAEAELTALLSEQVAAEIDREILRDLRRGAAWRLSWDYAGKTGRGIDTQNSAAFYTQKEWNQTLVTAINQVSAQIHKATLRGGANFIVCSAEISAIFDDLEYFHVSNAAPEQDKYNMGIERIGSLSGRYQVYRDPYFPADTILMGHKGTSLLDTGYIYAPYVPMQLTPTMYNPFTFSPVKGIMTRYAKKMVNNRFYGTIRVKNAVTFGINSFR